jgi:hypothetical protein
MVIAVPRSAISAASVRVTMPSLGGRGGRRPAQAALQRGHRGRSGGQQIGEQPDLAARSRRDDDGLAAPAGHRRPGVQHRHPIAEWRRLRHRRAGTAHGRYRLTGQQCLVDLQVMVGEQAGVRTDDITLPHQEDVAGHEIARGHLELLPPSPHPRPWGGQGPQAGHCVHRPALLDASDRGVHSDHECDHGGVGDVTGEHGQRQRCEEDQDHRFPLTLRLSADVLVDVAVVTRGWGLMPSSCPVWVPSCSTASPSEAPRPSRRGCCPSADAWPPPPRRSSTRPRSAGSRVGTWKPLAASRSGR